MSNIAIARIEFIQNDFSPKRVQRPMPERLRGLVTETDFDSFSDKVDALLKESHEVHSASNARMCWLFLAWILSCSSFFVYFANPPLGPASSFLFAIPYVLVGIGFFAVLVAACYFCSKQEAIVDEIKLECLKFTKRSAVATFKLVTIEVNDDDGSGVHMEISHIDVTISNSY